MTALYYWFDRYIDVLQQVASGKIVLAPLLLLFIEEAGIPIPVPGDIVIAYTGYRLSTVHGGGNFWAAFIIAQAAVITGATILFFLSRRWGQFILDRLGSYIFLQEKHIHKAEELFAKYGLLAIIVGRHIPGLRIPVTFFAATSGVRYWTFILSTFISTSLWIIFYLTIGRHLGVTFHEQLQRYIGVTVLGTVMLMTAIFVLHLIGKARKSRHSV